MTILRSVMASLALAAVVTAQDPAAAIMKEASAAFENGNFEQAAGLYEKYLKLKPEDGAAWHRLGYAHHSLGNLDKALPCHEKAASLGNSEAAATGAYNAACVHALKGNKDKAMEWLQKAKAKGFNNKGQIDQDSDMDSLRDDPRFKEFVNSMGAAPRTGQVRGFVGGSNRKEARVFYWGGDASPGQMFINYGPVTWKDSYAKQANDPSFLGKRWRLGSNSWTTLDNNVTLNLGGVKVPPGHYYVTLEKRAEGKFILALNDPAKIRAEHLDAFQADQTTGGIEVELQHATSDKVASELEIAFEGGNASATEGSLRIRFGNHELKTSYAAHLDS